MSIILFDGECNLCNRSVNFTIARDPKERFQFATLQSETGQQILSDVGLPADLTTVVLYDGGQAYVRSSAALRVCRRLRFPWPLLSIFLIVPPFLRDIVYRFVSKRRYSWFGKSDVCRVPTADDKKRFV
ncbi:MAG: DCC1-like thiol-disulfide oxidoreductase family protein [Planctomycetota bacterium]